MISWATKVDFLGTFEDCPEEVCSVCGKSGKPVYHVQQNYFKLYGLPIFPTAKVISKSCNLCRFQTKAKQTDGNLPTIMEVFPFKHKFKYYWGIIVFVLLIGLVSWFFVSVIP